jgi:rhodanese-related sulfurtransferase
VPAFEKGLTVVSGTVVAARMYETKGANAVSDRSAVDELLERARARLDRVPPVDLAGEQEAGALVVDIRPLEDRHRYGDLPGALVVDRNVLEWRLDPTCPHRLAEATDPDRRIIVVCNEGYSSSLAAAALHDLGLRRATDLIGGYRAWRAINPSCRGG